MVEQKKSKRSNVGKVSVIAASTLALFFVGYIGSTLTEASAGSVCLSSCPPSPVYTIAKAPCELVTITSPVGPVRGGDFVTLSASYGWGPSYTCTHFNDGTAVLEWFIGYRGAGVYKETFIGYQQVGYNGAQIRLPIVFQCDIGFITAKLIDPAGTANATIYYRGGTAARCP